MKNLQIIKTAIADRAIDLISTDVFDTLVLRTTRPELLRFWQLADAVCDRLPQNISPAVSQTDIFCARVLAARAAYRNSKRVQGCDEATVETIHRLQLSALGLPEKLAGLFLDAEIAYEIDDLKPNYSVISLLKEARSAGIKIIYASDMYLPATIIDRLLRSVGADLPFDGRYSSADTGLSKRAGPLFDHIAREQAVAPSKCLHIGDSKAGDYDRPRARGWQALHWPRELTWRLVHSARSAAFKTSLYAQHLAH